MNHNIEQLVDKWLTMNSANAEAADDYFCQTRDIFQARLDDMMRVFLHAEIKEDDVYILYAIAGEIGNNSFDHNLGNWPNVMGIFFGYAIRSDSIVLVLADRGVGILNTLKRVKPDLKNDSEALKTAFTKKISGRAPENRGNGLKFVKKSIADKKFQMKFYSGNAYAKLNNTFNIETSKETVNGCLAVLQYKL